MANTFCKNLSNTYRFVAGNGELMYQPCCWVPFMLPVSDATSLTQAQETIRQQVESKVGVNCYECIQREQTGYRMSGRQEANQYVPDDAIDGDAYILEYQISTNCNAACAMCGPHSSSLWAGRTRDFTKIYATMFDIIDFSKVRRIRFFGGEPMIGDEHKDVLARIPDPSLVDILYVTNGSVVPRPEVLELWSEFKQIKLTMSIDGVGPRFEYIRWPLKFEKIEKNLAKFLEFPNVVVSVHCTVSPMNLMFISELDQWSKAQGVSIGYSPCFGIWHINNATPALRNAALVELGSEHPAIKILESFPYSGSPKNLLTDLNKLDLLRGLDWKNTFPGADKWLN